VTPEWGTHHVFCLKFLHLISPMKAQIVNYQVLAIIYKVSYHDLLGWRSLQRQEMMASFAHGHKLASHFEHFLCHVTNCLGSLWKSICQWKQSQCTS
jgi:hypothetical protein